ncbi:portal protein [Roseospira navarrensis]|uniref:Phage tail protein n=1 Tax=Roseospira navarrensis TaxID=140058 RepID=A0A7X2D2A5_9PROT|nr:portal protein [Roseospira navarrensis]MQX35481.1 phage tail protein [Roseospira navarrensis]
MTDPTHPDPGAGPEADGAGVAVLLRRYRRARARRQRWEGAWRDCYDFALPSRESALGGATPGGARGDRLFDGTAPDAVDQLAASMLAQLTPPWSRWFDLSAGPDLSPEERDRMAPTLDRASEVLRAHFAASNFAVEIHQCYLDLVTLGTACLAFEEAPPGEPGAFRFAAVPMGDVALDEGPTGRLDTVFRTIRLPVSAVRARWPAAILPPDLETRAAREPDLEVAVLECVVPDARGYGYTALLAGTGEAATALGEGTAPVGGDPLVLATGHFAVSPFICFRWLKAPGEAYGRSPVMKALPDIKTANKVVELVLKNASIAVTGIWQADDDGVLNPATVRLVPGTIIPKAVGSAGLTPLRAAGDFDVSQLVLDGLRQRIRAALLADKLGQPDSPAMTATEVVHRAADMARVLGASYGRLQSELLAPLVRRGLAILRRRGEVPPIRLDGRLVDLTHASPLAQQQRMSDAQTTLTWINAVRGLGEGGARVIDDEGAARWLARTLGVPEAAVRPEGAAGPPGPAAPMPGRPPAPSVPAPGSGAPDWASLARALGGVLSGPPAGGGGTRHDP